jgi:penicillin G amidase
MPKGPSDKPRRRYSSPMIRHLPLLLALTSLAACHPLACFFPPALPRDPPHELTSKDGWPKDKVEVRVDDLGIPHIFGEREEDLAYALGVMHGRDRAFQILTYKHLSQGRLTELLGPDYLEVDRQNRLLMHRVDDQLEAFEDKDLALVEAYCAGVNEGAAWAGKSAEMFILGVEFGELTPYDVLGITRLQQWGQSVGFTEELDRWRFVKTLGRDDARVSEILKDAPSRGVPIVTDDEHDGDRVMAALAPGGVPTTSSASPTRSKATRGAKVPESWTKEIVDGWVRGMRHERGASNEYAVDAEHTKSGVPIMANDPHLQHTGPGIFYMVHMEGPDFTVAGGTFPGIPAVLIGHGRDIAWGVTNACADTQDLVVLEPVAGSEDHYMLDGAPMNYQHVEQCFKLGKEDDADEHCETYLVSVFGPVLPKGYGSYDGARPWVDDDERLALMWTAWHYPRENNKLVSAFWRLAQSKTKEDATAALQDFSSPSMSVVFAMTDGTIAYRLTGVVPVRGDEQRVDFPRRGGARSSGWLGRLPAAQKPQSTNPSKGFIVAANQRIVENDVLTQRTVGFESVQPWRARRIVDRIEKMLEDKKPSAEELLSIQQDTVSLEAVELAEIYADHCPKSVEGYDDSVVDAFCKAIGGMKKGDYAVDAIAVPFALTNRHFQLAVFESMVDDELAVDLIGDTWSQMALIDAIKAEHAGDAKHAVFDDPRTPGREGLDGFVAMAVKRALDVAKRDHGLSEGDWRWGKPHQKSVRGALASAPVIGGLFDTWYHEEGGMPSAPRAEAPNYGRQLKVSYGAGLRLIAELKEDGAEVRMVNDSGQSGHFGHHHVDSQQPLWSAGTPVKLRLSKKQVEEVLEGSLDVLPK